MKLTLLQENLVKVLANASRIVTSKAQIPILSHFKLDATSSSPPSKGGAGRGLVTISATDLEIGLKLSVAAQVAEPGSLTVPARVLTELITNTSPGNLQLTTGDPSTSSGQSLQLKISGGGNQANIAGMSAEEFPELPEFTDKNAISLPSDQLIQAVNKVAHSAATDDSRPVLTAIQIKLTKEGMELAATDGFRLSWLHLPSKLETGNLKLETSYLIPARALQEAVRLIDPSVKAVKFVPLEKGNQVIFQIDHIQLTSRLISGEFPAVQKVMPDSGDTIVEMDRLELLRAMRLAAIFARESANIVKFAISPPQIRGAGGGNLKISANAPQVGGQESTVDASVEGPAAQIAFNYRYILDFLNASQSSSIKFLMTSSLGPGLWLESESSKSKSKGSSDTALQYKHVIMPVRVESNE